MPRLGTLVVLVLVVIIAASCGARLSPSQLSAALSTSGSSDNGAVGTGDNNAGQSSGGESLPGQSGTSATAVLGTTTTAVGSSGKQTNSVGTTPTTQAASNPSGQSTALSAEGLSVNPAVCAGTASGTGITSSQITVGTVTTLTGPVPGLFEAAEYGVNAFAAYINNEGGICGRKLVFDIADDDLSASQNQTAVQSLAPSVFAFVGSLSGDDQGGASTLQSNGIPDVGEALSPQRSALPNNFSPEPVPCGINLAPYEYYKQKYPNAITHMAVLSINQPTDLYETECQQAALETLGYKFVYSDENIALTQSDFSSDAEAMKAAGAEGVVFVATASYYAEVATAAQNAGLNMQLPFYDVNEYDPLYVSQAGSAANGSITASPFEMYQGQDAISNPTIALFDKYYEAVSGGSAPNEFGIWAWMSGMLFIEGLNAGGGLTRADLLSGLSKVTAFTAGGMEGPSNPAAKTAPSCWLAIDVVNQKFVRDPADPATGMICPSSNTYDTITNIPFPS